MTFRGEKSGNLIGNLTSKSEAPELLTVVPVLSHSGAFLRSLENGRNHREQIIENANLVDE